MQAGVGQSAETAASKWTSLKHVNDWRQARAASGGGGYFRCPRCDMPRFVPATSKPDAVLHCTRARQSPPGLSGEGNARPSDAGQRRACTFAARTRTWRALQKEGANGDGPRGRTILDMLGAVRERV